MHQNPLHSVPSYHLTTQRHLLQYHHYRISPLIRTCLCYLVSHVLLLHRKVAYFTILPFICASTSRGDTVLSSNISSMVLESTQVPICLYPLNSFSYFSKLGNALYTSFSY